MWSSKGLNLLDRCDVPPYEILGDLIWSEWYRIWRGNEILKNPSWLRWDLGTSGKTAISWIKEKWGEKGSF